MKWLILEYFLLGLIAWWQKWPPQTIIFVAIGFLLVNAKEIVSAVSQTAKATKT